MILKMKEHAYGGTWEWRINTTRPLGDCDDCTVNNCVRLGEYPSAETMVGVLQQTVSPRAQLRRKQVQIGKSVKLSEDDSINICIRERREKSPLCR